ncbi:MAG: bifunctional diaminohydroxyphosphoribosylaminopyrimidine deaminase/5-amino-6-(5-phosphoribosylamino)uracil reductase RibD [Bacilli bacterium]
MRDENYMQLALSMAKAMDGQTFPNPTVGCVIVKNGQIVGIGSHLKVGTPHAEVHALTMAGENAKGATAYVTLEPCSHFGRTPPCANALVNAGVKKVFIATTDANPKVSGNGVAILNENGIETEIGLCKEEADALNAHFFHFMRTGLPFVTLKSASTIDGKIAASDGSSQWITSAASRESVHIDRAKHHGILVGAGTVCIDNPSLTVRLNETNRQPIRIIIDRSLKTPIDSKVYSDQAAQTIVITANNQNEDRIAMLRDKGVEVETLAYDQFTAQQILQCLGKRDIVSVYVEGGSSMHSMFLRERLWQELHVYIGSKLLGGNSLGWTDSLNIASMQESEVLKLKNVIVHQSDVQLIYRNMKELE